MKRIAFFMGAFAAFAGKANAQPKEIPVIIIMADQLRYDAVGQYTPHINQLKQDGVSFNRTYCASPLCAPSRAAFFTGKYPNNNGCLINGWQQEDEHYREVRSGTANLYQVMAANWDSWHIGKQHFFTQDAIDKDPQSKTKWTTEKTYKQWVRSLNVKAPGGGSFKAIAPELISAKYTSYKNYSTPDYAEYKPGMKYFDDEYYANKSIDVIRGHQGGKPLLLNLMFLSPHPPFNIPEPYFSRFKAGDLTVPANVGKWYAGQSPLQLYNITGFIGTRYSRKEWEQVWLKYTGLVSLLDDEVGKVIEALKAKGLYDKALIIFTADHGEMLGSHSLWQKMCMYEESAHVPLIIKFPAGFKPAMKATNDIVSLIDVWPTLIDYLHIDNAGDADGLSLMPLLQGKKEKRGHAFIQYDGNGAYGNNQRCMVQGDYKLIIDTFKDEVFIELYNITKDPQETENLATNKDYESITKAMIEKVRAHMAATNDLVQLPTGLYENFIAHYLHDKNAGGGE